MQLSFSDYSGLRYFRGLDGLRALSVIMVIGHHMEDRPFYWLDGASGVSIFFVLSGYLITTLLLKEERAKNRVRLKAFYIRRSFRILPIYYIVVAIYCILIFGFDQSVFASKRQELLYALPSYLFYMNEFHIHGTGAGFGHSWSLGVEEKFYLVWPVLGFVLISSARYLRMPVVLGVMAVVFVISHFYPSLYILGYYKLLVGCMLALLLDREESYRFIGSIVSKAGTVFVIPAFVIVHLLKPEYKFLDIIYPITVALLIAMIITTNTWLTRFLETAPVRTVGRVSYGIYLIHVLVLNAVHSVIKPGVGQITVGLSVLIIATILTSMIAYGMSILIERPLTRQGRRIAKKFP